jgi:hypothetical protein
MSLEPQRKSSIRKRLIIVSIAVMAAAALSYVWYDYRFPAWKEEVLLPDGRIIVVKQRRDFIEGYGTRKTWLTFSLPEMGGEHTWAENLMPSVIGAEQGKVYVLGMPRGPKQYSMYGGPRFFLVAFVWTDSTFQRVPVEQVPLAIRQAENVFRCLAPLHATITWMSKIAQWCESPTKPGSLDRALDYEGLELLSQKYARMDGQTTFSK